MGVPLDGPTHVRVDNMSVVHNTTAPESTLKKKSNSIAYHFVRENVASRVIRIAYENTKTNLADCATKLQSGLERLRIVSRFMKWGFWLFPPNVKKKKIFFLFVLFAVRPCHWHFKCEGTVWDDVYWQLDVTAVTPGVNLIAIQRVRKMLIIFVCQWMHTF